MMQDITHAYAQSQCLDKVVLEGFSAVQTVFHSPLLFFRAEPLSPAVLGWSDQARLYVLKWRAST